MGTFCGTELEQNTVAMCLYGPYACCRRLLGPCQYPWPTR